MKSLNELLYGESTPKKVEEAVVGKIYKLSQWGTKELEGALVAGGLRGTDLDFAKFIKAKKGRAEFAVVVENDFDQYDVTYVYVTVDVGGNLSADFAGVPEEEDIDSLSDAIKAAKKLR